MHQITITGVPADQHTVADPLPSRREIHDLIKDRKQFSLYVQAIRKLVVFLATPGSLLTIIYREAFQ